MIIPNLPHRLAVALDEYHQALAKLNNPMAQYPDDHQHRVNIQQREDIFRYAAMKRLESLQWVMTHPDMPWVRDVPSIDSDGGDSGRPTLRWILTHQSAIPNVIKKLVASGAREAAHTVKATLLPHHWYVPEVTAFLVHFCAAHQLPTYIAVVGMLYPHVDDDAKEIHVDVKADSQARWWQLLDFLWSRINRSVHPPPQLLRVGDPRFIETVIQFYLYRSRWYGLDIDPTPDVPMLPPPEEQTNG